LEKEGSVHCSANEIFYFTMIPQQNVIFPVFRKIKKFILPQFGSKIFILPQFRSKIFIFPQKSCFKNWVKAVMALPLLPANKIEYAYTFLKDRIRTSRSSAF
jgi:hypothetical protein